MTNIVLSKLICLKDIVDTINENSCFSNFDLMIKKLHELYIITNLFINDRTTFQEYVLIIFFLSQNFHFRVNSL